MELKITRADGLIEEPAFYIVVLRDSDGFEKFRATISQDEADAQAEKLSRVVNDDHTVRLETLSRVKAIYKSGQRTRVNDMESFYLLTPEQIANSKIKDSRTAEMI